MTPLEADLWQKELDEWDELIKQLTQPAQQTPPTSSPLATAANSLIMRQVSPAPTMPLDTVYPDLSSYQPVHSYQEGDSEWDTLLQQSPMPSYFAT